MYIYIYVYIYIYIYVCTYIYIYIFVFHTRPQYCNIILFCKNTTKFESHGRKNGNLLIKDKLMIDYQFKIIFSFVSNKLLIID